MNRRNAFLVNFFEFVDYDKFCPTGTFWKPNISRSYCRLVTIGISLKYRRMEVSLLLPHPRPQPTYLSSPATPALVTPLNYADPLETATQVTATTPPSSPRTLHHSNRRDGPSPNDGKTHKHGRNVQQRRPHTVTSYVATSIGCGPSCPPQIYYSGPGSSCAPRSTGSRMQRRRTGNSMWSGVGATNGSKRPGIGGRP